MVIYGVWLCIFGFLAAHHAAWRDEYQAWLVATRTTSWTEFFTAVRLERQPPIYYLLLKSVAPVLSWIGIPFRRCPHLISWFLAAATVALVIFKVRAPAWLRYSLPFTSLFLIEYSLIARSYTLALFFMVAAICLRQTGRRYASWWCLALCGSVHLYFLAVCIGLFVVAFWNDTAWSQANVRDFAHATGIGILFGLTFFLLLPPPDTSYSKGITTELIRPMPILINLAYGLTGLDAWSGPFRWNANLWKTTFPWPLAAFLLAIPHQKRQLLIFLAVAALPLTLMTGSGYGVSYRHAAPLFCALLYLSLVGQDRFSERRPVIAIFVVLMLFGSYRWLAALKPWDLEAGRPLSGADELVRAVGPQIQRAVTIIDHGSEAPSFSVVGQFERTPALYSASRNRYIQYPEFRRVPRTALHIWCGRNRNQLEAQLGEDTPVFLLLMKGTHVPHQCRPARAIFRSSRPSIAYEDYALYELEPGTPAP